MRSVQHITLFFRRISNFCLRLERFIKGSSIFFQKFWKILEKFIDKFGGYEKFKRTFEGYEKCWKHLWGRGRKMFDFFFTYEKFWDFLKNPNTPPARSFSTRPPSGVREGRNWLFLLVCEFVVKMTKWCSWICENWKICWWIRTFLYIPWFVNEQNHVHKIVNETRHSSVVREFVKKDF